jgi:hypothetical protein
MASGRTTRRPEGQAETGLLSPSGSEVRGRWPDFFVDGWVTNGFKKILKVFEV